MIAAWSWRTALGSGVSARDALLGGATGILPAPELAPYGVPFAAKIPGEPAPGPNDRYLHRVARFGVEAAVEVAREWPGDRDRLGVFTALGGLRALWGDLDVAMADQRDDAAAPWVNGLSRVHPYWMLRHLSNNAHALLAIALGARGEGTTTAGPVAGASAIQAAIRALHAGVLDAAVVMACDGLLQPEILLEGAVRGRWADRVPGEAAVALLLRRPVSPEERPWIQVEAGLSGPLPDPAPTPDLGAALGDTGAAAPLLAAVALAGRPGDHHLDVAGAPGLAARITVGA